MLHALLGLGLVAGVVAAQEPTPSSVFARWEIVDPGGRADALPRARLAVPVRRPRADAEVAFADGVIAFDVAMHGQPGFAGVRLPWAVADRLRAGLPPDAPIASVGRAAGTRRCSGCRKRGNSIAAPATTARRSCR